MNTPKHNKFVVFENDGELDARSIRTFGMSVKDTENPIGFFGTGLKYAIAILMRENHFAAVIAGTTHYLFEKKAVTVRGKPFEVITMNGEELPFTTHLGVNWKMWQAFREIYCNCLDEGGKVYIADEVPEPVAGKTFFIVGGKDFETHYHLRKQIVLEIPESLKVGEVGGVAEIYDAHSRGVYYRGIQVFEYEKPFAFTYNIQCETTLTEDRTLKFPDQVFYTLVQAVSQMKNRAAIRKIITAPTSVKESDMNFLVLQYGDYNGNDFQTVLQEEFEANNELLNRTARELNKKLRSKKSQKELEIEKMTPVQEKQLERAVSVCTRVFPDFGDYKIIVVKSLGSETFGMADIHEREIIISKQCFMMGTKYLASTLIEEYMHCKTKYPDESRNLQTYLFDTICTLIEDHVIGEPI